MSMFLELLLGDLHPAVQVKGIQRSSQPTPAQITWTWLVTLTIKLDAVMLFDVNDPPSDPEMPPFDFKPQPYTVRHSLIPRPCCVMHGLIPRPRCVMHGLIPRPCCVMHGLIPIPFCVWYDLIPMPFCVWYGLIPIPFSKGGMTTFLTLNCPLP